MHGRNDGLRRGHGGWRARGGKLGQQTTAAIMARTRAVRETSRGLRLLEKYPSDPRARYRFGAVVEDLLLSLVVTCGWLAVVAPTFGAGRRLPMRPAGGGMRPGLAKVGCRERSQLAAPRDK
ncbi:hypothetical protein LY76DRAFT_303130 [Colletotrichum caudatum]|nr:hypothetical protein LY76DRAFT_303130 [Colletotrichum caudatum]